MTLTATNTPIRETPKGSYCCGRCGIIRECTKSRPAPDYCMDCLGEARLLGWATPHWKQRAA